MRKAYFLLGLGLLFFQGLQGQVLPPDFLCVRSDTLIWEPAVNTCGPFESYLIYASQEEDGPYVLLATITDPAQTRFYNPDGPGQEWFYYLESNHDCPGLQMFASDTLDNRIPAIGPLSYVTVDGNTVEMEWSPSPSTEVFAYIIARDTDFGTQDIDTVFTGNSYTDFNADPQNQSELYYVVALDRCGNRSLVDFPHNTMFLQITGQDACERTINIEWNEYINWGGDVDRYEVWVSEDGGAYNLVDQVGGANTNYVFQNAQDGREYCFRIEAVEGGTEVRSVSSDTCVQVDVVQPLTSLRFDNATVNPDGTTQLNWRWSPDAELSMAEVFFQVVGDDVVGVLPDYVFGGTLNAQEQVVFSSMAANSGPVNFRIEATDECGDMYSSNRVQTVFLSGSLLADQTTQLSWTAYENDSAAVQQYDIYQIRNGIAVFVDEVGPEVLQYEVPFNPADPSQFSSCYYVVAQLELDNGNGGVLALESRSNIACVERTAELFVPNAFVPDGVNRIFKPILQFGSPADYQLQIWDRWGQLLFETNDFNMGWNGMKDDRAMPQGTYVYRISLTRSNGSELVKQGMLTLLR